MENNVMMGDATSVMNNNPSSDITHYLFPDGKENLAKDTLVLGVQRIKGTILQRMWGGLLTYTLPEGTELKEDGLFLLGFLPERVQVRKV
jgi:hypothetical protein